MTEEKNINENSVDADKKDNAPENSSTTEKENTSDNNEASADTSSIEDNNEKENDSKNDETSANTSSVADYKEKENVTSDNEKPEKNSENKGGFISTIKLFIGIPISLGCIVLLSITYLVTQFHSLRKEQVTTLDAPMGILFLLLMIIAAIGVFIYISLYVNRKLVDANKKSLYRRIWYIALIVITVLSVILSLILNII